MLISLMLRVKGILRESAVLPIGRGGDIAAYQERFYARKRRRERSQKKRVKRGTTFKQWNLYLAYQMHCLPFGQRSLVRFLVVYLLPAFIFASSVSFVPVLAACCVKR